jgi:hypothetical protein
MKKHNQLQKINMAPNKPRDLSLKVTYDQDNTESEYSGDLIPKDTKLKFDNLLLIDEKLQVLTECLKKNAGT